jgi:nucleoside-diphosphate-sugar epimerase
LDSLQTTDALFESQSVDIRDVAPQHIAALTIPEAGGQRFLSTAGNITVQHVCKCSNTTPFLTCTTSSDYANLLFTVVDILNSKPVNLALPQGYPEVLKDWKPQYVLSNEKAKKILSTTYRPLEDTVRTTVEHALSIGWTQ